MPGELTFLTSHLVPVLRSQIAGSRSWESAWGLRVTWTFHAASFQTYKVGISRQSEDCKYIGTSEQPHKQTLS